MQHDPAAPRTRRSLLVAGVGGAIAAAAAALARPSLTRAANGDPVTAGAETTATLATTVRNTADGTGALIISGNDAVSPANQIGVYGYANQSASARAVYGKSLQGTGVWGNSDTGRGLFGRSTSGTGVSAQTDTGRAVYGSSAAGDKASIVGVASGNSTGVHGHSGSGLYDAIPQAGVMGSADQDEDAIGVLGLSGRGTGVIGSSQEGIGVYGNGPDGVYGLGYYGTIGDTDQGVGVYGWTGAGAPIAGPPRVGVLAGAEPGRTALFVDGVAAFSRSGLTSIGAGGLVKLIENVQITENSLGFAMLQQSRPGIWVRAVILNHTNDTLTIYLNTGPGSTTKIAWWVIN